MASPPRGQYYDVAGYSNSNIFTLVTTTRVTVYVAQPYAASPLTTLASIYSAETGAGTPGNPFNATTGEISFWAAPGSYDLKIEDTGSPAKFATKFLRWDVLPADEGVAGTMIADAAIDTTKILDGTVGTADIAAGAITAAKIEPQQAWQMLTLSRFTSQLAYMKDSLGFVHARADILTTNAQVNSGDVLGTFPAGYRPGTDIILLGFTGSGGGGVVSPIKVTSAGVITPLNSGFVAGTYVISLPPWRAEN
jgi:hypothetical protein